MNVRYILLCSNLYSLYSFAACRTSGDWLIIVDNEYDETRLLLACSFCSEPGSSLTLPRRPARYSLVADIIYLSILYMYIVVRAKLVCSLLLADLAVVSLFMYQYLYTSSDRVLSTAHHSPQQAALGAAADALDGRGKTPPATTAVTAHHHQREGGGVGQEAEGVSDESATGAQVGEDGREGEKSERAVQLVRFFLFVPGGRCSRLMLGNPSVLF